MTIYTPLEQFEIIALLPILHTNHHYWSITNSTLFTLISVGLLCVGFYGIQLQNRIIPTR